MTKSRASLLFDAGYLLVGLTVCVLAGLGWFRTMDSFPAIFGMIWALAGALSLLLWRRTRRPAIHNLLVVFGAILALLAPVSQAVHQRNREAHIAEAALAKFDGGEAPSLAADYAVNAAREEWANPRWEGRYTLIAFWATWCSPCLKEFPLLEEFSREYDAEVLRVVGYTRFYRSEGPGPQRDEELREIREVLERHGVTYPTLVEAGTETHAKFGVVTLPTTVLVDPAGRVAAYGVGLNGTSRVLRHARHLLLQGGQALTIQQ